MCSPNHHHNSFVASLCGNSCTCALDVWLHIALLVPVNRRVLNMLSREVNASGHK